MLTLTGLVPMTSFSVVDALEVLDHDLLWIALACIALSLVAPSVRDRWRHPSSSPEAAPGAGGAPAGVSAHDTLRSLEPRRMEPSPALSHPATQGQQWRQKHYWVVRLFALWFIVIVVQGVVRGLHDHGDSMVLALVLAPVAVFLCVIAHLVDEVPRQKRLLRRSPWVEYPVASVKDTGYTKVGRVNVSFLDAEEIEHSYQMDPNDDDFERGDRPIWFAGTPGRQWAVLSLRRGDCTGMGYTRWVGSFVGIHTGASARAARRTAPPVQGRP